MSFEILEEPPPPNSLSPAQLFVIPEELATAAHLILRGLDEATRPSSAPQEHTTLLLLSQGYERLFKIAFCLEHEASQGAMPALLKRSYGHQVGRLIDTLCARLQESDDIGVQADLRTIASDPRYEYLFALLDDWGTGGRYFDLDSILSDSLRIPQDRFADPRSRFRELGLLSVFEARVDFTRVEETPAGFAKELERVTGFLVAFLQRPARLIAHGFRAGSFGPLAEYFSPCLRPFIVDDDGLRHVGEHHEVEYGPIWDSFMGPPLDERPT